MNFQVRARSGSLLLIGVLTVAYATSAPPTSDDGNCNAHHCDANRAGDQEFVASDVELLQTALSIQQLASNPAHLSSKLDELTEFVEETSSNSSLVAEAKDVEAELHHGGLQEVRSDPQAEAEIVDLLDKVSQEVTPVEAVLDGFEVTTDDLVNLHHGVNMEEVRKDAFQGDMVPKDEAQRLLLMQMEANLSKGRGTYAWAGDPWPNGVVKYCLSADLPANAIKAWQLSVKQYQKAVPCIQFVDVGYKSGTSSLEENGECLEEGSLFVQAEPTDGCWSYVGRLSHKPYQALQIASPGCDSVGTTMHEIGHALGMAHEQSRPDRDEYVSVDLSNTDEAPQFKINPNGDTVRPYDILSLMHYGLGDFALDRSKPVITVKPAGYARYTTDPAEYDKYEIGDRIGLSQDDASQLADMYNSVVPGGCVANNLVAATTCVDKLRDGKPFKDGYGSCDKYRATSTPEDPCSQYTAGSYCCGCGGGWEVQSYSEAGHSPEAVQTPEQEEEEEEKEEEADSTKCADSTTYFDPKYGDSCSEWVGFTCTGYEFSEQLQKNCPTACKTCTPWGTECVDSTTYYDPKYGDSCSEWVGFTCTGYEFTEQLQKHCPVACKLCVPPPTPDTTSTTTTTTIDMKAWHEEYDNKMKMNRTKMFQSKLPPRSKHINAQTIEADWLDEYENPPPTLQQAPAKPVPNWWDSIWIWFDDRWIEFKHWSHLTPVGSAALALTFSALVLATLAIC